MTRLQELTEDECIRLVRSHTPTVGRLAFYSEDGLTVLPINYLFSDGEVFFHTDAGSILYAAVLESRVAFEVDAVNTSWREGWSVLVRGTAREVMDPDKIEAVSAHVRSWAERDARTIAITPSQITGRRIV